MASSSSTRCARGRSALDRPPPWIDDRDRALADFFLVRIEPARLSPPKLTRSSTSPSRQARDLNISNSPRQEGASRFALQKLSTAQTTTRAKESIARLNQDVAAYVDKAYWTQARNELRRQLGTLRYDVNNLVEAKGSSAAEAKAFIKNVEKLDFAIRQKDSAAAKASLAVVQEQGDSLMKSLA